MYRSLLILVIFFIVATGKTYSQITWYFDQPQCGNMEDHGYTYSNGYAGYGGTNYTIYFLGDPILEIPYKENITTRINDMFFISYSTGFYLSMYYVNQYPYNAPWERYYIHRTKDYAETWDIIKVSKINPNIYGPPHLKGWYVLTLDEALLVTFYDNIKEYLFFNDVLIDSVFNEDKTVYFKTFGKPICYLDTLKFNLYREEGTTTYTIVIDNTYKEPELGSTPLFVKNYAVSDYLYINEEFHFIENETTALIFNSSGQLAKKITFGDYRKIYIGDLKPGMYIFKVMSNDNPVTAKFIKL